MGGGFENAISSLAETIKEETTASFQDATGLLNHPHPINLAASGAAHESGWSPIPPLQNLYIGKQAPQQLLQNPPSVVQPSAIGNQTNSSSNNGNNLVIQHKLENLARDHELAQQDLEISLEIVSKLRSENEVLKENFEELKTSYLQMQQRNNHLQLENESLNKEKASLEEKLEQSTLEWKSVVETKERELANAKAEALMPQDMELIRLKVIEEFEAGNDKKWQTVNVEIEKYRNLYFQTRRELEMELAEFERFRNEHNSRVSEIELAHETELHAMEVKLYEMQKIIDDFNEDEKVKELSRDNLELQAKVNALNSELEETRAQKEAKTMEYESQSRNQSHIISQQKAEFASLEAEKTAMANRLNRMEIDLHQTSKQYEELQEDHGRISKEVARINSRYEESLHNFNIEMSNLKIQSAKERTNLEQVNTSLSRKYEEYKSLYEESERAMADMRVKIEEAEKQVYAKVRNAREEEATRINGLEEEKRQLEGKIQDLKVKLTEDKHVHESVLKENQIALNRLKDEIRNLEVQIHKQTIQGQKLQDENENLQVQAHNLEKNNRDLQEVKQKQASQLEKQREKELYHRDKISSLENRVNEISRQCARLSNELEKERAAFQITVRRLKTVHSRDLQAATKSASTLEGLYKQSKSELDSLINYTKKLKAKYKAKNEFFESSNKELSSKNEKLELELGALRKALETVSTQTNNQLSELNRRHQEFSTFLGKEAANFSSNAGHSNFEYPQSNNNKISEYISFEKGSSSINELAKNRAGRPFTNTGANTNNYQNPSSLLNSTASINHLSPFELTQLPPQPQSTINSNNNFNQTPIELNQRQQQQQQFQKRNVVPSISYSTNNVREMESRNIRTNQNQHSGEMEYKPLNLSTTARSESGGGFFLAAPTPQSNRHGPPTDSGSMVVQGGDESKSISNGESVNHSPGYSETPLSLASSPLIPEDEIVDENDAADKSAFGLTYGDGV